MYRSVQIELLSSSGVWPYNSREGYIISDVAIEMAVHYDCIARRGGVKDQRMAFDVGIMRKF